MWQPVLQVFLGMSIAIITVAAVLYALFGWNSWRLIVRVAQWLAPRRPPPKPVGRPIEQIAQHARRLWRQSRMPERGRSRAKQVAISRAYDDVLGEGCEALGFAHLLGVLDGADLEAERDRVEDVLEAAGLELRQLN